MFRAFKSLVVLSMLLAQFAVADRLYPLFPGSVVIAPAVIEQTNDWELALSKNRKVDGRWFFDKSLTLKGSVEAVTYRIHTKKRLVDLARFYQTFAETGDKELLFSCKGRSCGSSNEWANTHFLVKELYGPDINQRYWAIKVDANYLAMYLIERGNGRIYLHAETLTVAQ